MQEHIITNSDGGMKSSNDGKWDPKGITALDIYKSFEFDLQNMRIAVNIDDLYNGELSTWSIDINLSQLLKFYRRLQQPILDGKYPAYNFCKMKSQESLDQIYESARRHFKQYLEGDTTEDHYSAVLANMCFMYIIWSNRNEGNDFYEI